MHGFFTIAGAELDDAFDRRGADNLSGVSIENRVFRAGQIIFRQFADPFEKFGTALVVKVVDFLPAWLIPQGS